MFTRSPRGGKPPVIDNELINKFLDNCKTAKIKNYYVHTPYFINLASGKSELRKNSINLVREELERSNKLKVKYIMTHIGSSAGMDRDQAIDNVISSIKEILKNYKGETKLLLENTAGQGHTIGIRFEEIAEILHKVDYDELGVCLDTAHMFASGYDLRTKQNIDDLVDIISNTVTLSKIKLIHGNDSKVDFNSKKDRHEHIGKGKIGIGGFKFILKNKYLSKFDMIVETPPDGVEEDIKILKKLRNGS
ncbi:MAG: deoxyribonuclease IV [Candidatus Dadabacteria bacterium]|nr:deoxyribonuclease IV [Candidatus Dadabacteria bacterium]NIQ16022.1 deoxyribonuclease IV [Candidatus Dadabacteria bacterium]